ncbi:hypothetical protein [Streptomyces tsukubensis]|uniref:hypothetical protein n=1 Tax=Streptomyces tsukubensis TaxID=83656 RepID=UPI00344DD0DE
MRDLATLIVEEGTDINEGCVREFWVGTEGPWRHTLSVDSTRRGIELKWCVDTPGASAGDDFEREFTMEIGTDKAWRLVKEIEREIHHEGRD